eukprot:scaffold66978_cov72-Phaeocystis_antarctica.AAC.5
MGLQSQIPSPVAGGTRPTVPCQDQLKHATPCCLEALLLRQLDAARAAMLPCASLWAAACGPGGVWPCGGVWSRAMRVEGRRRPKKRWVEARGREGKRAIKNLRSTGS